LIPDFLPKAGSFSKSSVKEGKFSPPVQRIVNLCEETGENSTEQIIMVTYFCNWLTVIMKNMFTVFLIQNPENGLSSKPES